MNAETPPAIAFGRATLLPTRRQLLIDGVPANLGARAFDLLQALIEERGRVVGKTELLERVWRDVVVEENNLQVHISALRKLLGPDAIVTVPGHGYRFTATIRPDQTDALLPGTARDAGAAAPPLPPVLPPGQTPRRVRCSGNLSVEAPAIFGREDDLKALQALLAIERLVTVVGAGGIGKTTVAQALGRRLQVDHADGVWLVELAPVSQPCLVGAAIAAALGLSLTSEAQSGEVARALASSDMLIILDNCEHLIHAVAEVAAAIHRVAPRVRLLATSQEPLRVPAEQVYRLATLSVAEEASAGDAAEDGAIALFAARARAVDPGFRLDGERLEIAATICRQLDGIPLAIELAAARVALLGLEGLRDRLGERFCVLTAGSRLALRRHQTLRAALEWSHGLLTPEECRVFRRLGVFVGGFCLEAAQSVAAMHGMGHWEVLDHLGALVDKSLVVTVPGPPTRYRLLESARAFALEKLHEAGETEACMAAHAGAVLALFEASYRQEFERPLGCRLADYLPEIDNLRAAIDWAAGPRGTPSMQIALAGAAAWIWADAGLRPEGMRRTGEAMARIDADTPAALEACLLGSWSALRHPQSGERELAADRRAVELYGMLGNARARYVAMCELARTLTKNRQLDAAAAVLEEAERAFDPGWPPVLRMRWLIARSWQYKLSGRIEEALQFDSEVLALGRASQDQRIETWGMVYLEQGAAALGRWDEAVARGRALYGRIHAEPELRAGFENLVLINLSTALAQAGELDEACAFARLAYPCEERAGRTPEMLDPLATLALLRGRTVEAARIHGRAERLAAEGVVQRQLVERTLRDRLALDLHSHFSASELAEWMRSGETLSVCEALALAAGDAA